jgi:hypothetical protein
VNYVSTYPPTNLPTYIPTFVVISIKNLVFAHRMQKFAKFHTISHNRTPFYAIIQSTPLGLIYFKPIFWRCAPLHRRVNPGTGNPPPPPQFSTTKVPAAASLGVRRRVEHSPLPIAKINNVFNYTSTLIYFSMLLSLIIYRNTFISYFFHLWLYITCVSFFFHLNCPNKIVRPCRQMSYSILW